MKNHQEPRKRSLNQRLICALAALSLIGVGIAALVFLFGDFILNSYVRTKVEKAFAAAHPGQVLRIGPMEYSWRKDDLMAGSVLLTTPESNFSTGRVAIHHLHWASFFSKPVLARILANANFEAANLRFEYSSPHYELRCARLQASVPAASMGAEEISLCPQTADDEFFAAHPFRSTRLRVFIPSCRVGGLSYSELFGGTACRARLLELSGLDLNALVDRERIANPEGPPGVMINEALGALGKIIALDVITLTNGQVKYCERRAAGGPAGVLTFGAIQLSAKGLVSGAPPGAAMSIQAQGNLMNAGTLKVAMSLPLVSSDFSLDYAGSLSAMDMSRLNPFLEIAERLRITSCQAEGVTYNVHVKAGRATGSVQPVYRNLEIALLDSSGSQKGAVNRLESMLANGLKIRDSSLPDKSGLVRIGNVSYERKPQDTFLQFIWFSLRSGVLDSIHT